MNAKRLEQIQGLTQSSIRTGARKGFLSSPKRIAIAITTLFGLYAVQEWYFGSKIEGGLESNPYSAEIPTSEKILNSKVGDNLPSNPYAVEIPVIQGPIDLRRAIIDKINSEDQRSDDSLKYKYDSRSWDSWITEREYP